MSIRIKQIAAAARAFLRAKRGNVAMMFAIAMVPMTIAAGAGLDFARAMLVRQQMAEALDAAALAVGSTTGLDQTSAQALAQKYFDANYTIDKTAFGTPTVTIPNLGYNANGSVQITATTPMPTILMKLAGITSLPVSTTSTVVWGQSKLWVALVLDNSGSMSQGDSNGSKMDALQNASHQLLTILQNAATNQGDIMVSLVPFASVVKPNLSGTTYIDYREFDSQPPLGTGFMTITATVNSGLSFTAYGPGDGCPFDGTDGYVCAPTSTNDSNCSPDISRGSDCVTTIPSSGTTKGLICPSMHGYSTWTDGTPDRFYNGCYSSTKNGTTKITVASGRNATCSGFASANCSCTGSGSSTVCKTQSWTHAWVTNNHSTWTGCVMDRQQNGLTTYGGTAATQDYDASDTTPSSGDSLFPALNTTSCLTAHVTPFPATWTATQWTTLGTQVDAMAPGGATNQALGLEHGWQTLTTGQPYGAPTLPANTARYIILLSDGLNTQDRWYGNGRTEKTSADDNIDTRMGKACTAAKADGVIIYTIFLDIGGTDGNSTPLQNCATDSSKYYDLTSTSGVVTTFTQIAQQITNVRVSK